MRPPTRTRFDVLVIGAGPAGIAAAVRAAEAGVNAAIVDDNVASGGQIWRGALGENHSPEAASWHQRLRDSRVTTLCGYRVFDQVGPGALLAEGNRGLVELRYNKLILATGARERFLPFPGWTLPNVMGAGGLQALVKSGLPIRGKRVLVAGSGPLLLAVASYLHKHGAEIPLICEQASSKDLARFVASLLSFPKKISQAFQLRMELSDIPFGTSAWPTEAHGKQKLEAVTIFRNGHRQTIPCDYLACGFHLVPNVELPILLGCEIKDGHVQIDDLQQTTVPGIYCAGEPTGIGGVESSLVQGQIAGLTATGKTAEARKLFGERRRTRRFARLLDRTFMLREELKQLVKPETLVCRCEDVGFSKLQIHKTWRSAKLHTRCGMGPCQGRICGPAAEFLFGWKVESVRPPVFPVRVESLAGGADEPVIAGGAQ
jgi:NADPH-dependent 2,4-dienoyl-CoA reductase/sulfur reductase-like enzyme